MRSGEVAVGPLLALFPMGGVVTSFFRPRAIARDSREDLQRAGLERWIFYAACADWPQEGNDVVKSFRCPMSGIALGVPQRVVEALIGAQIDV